MKQFPVTSIETEPDGQVILYGPRGILKIRRHQSDDPGFDYNFSHAVLLKPDTGVLTPESHVIKVQDLEIGEGTAF